MDFKSSLQNVFNDVSTKFIDVTKYAKSGSAVESYKSMDDADKQQLIFKTFVVALAAFTLGKYIPVVPVVVTVTVTSFYSVMNDLMNHDAQYQGFTFGQDFAQNITSMKNHVTGFCHGLYKSVVG